MANENTIARHLSSGLMNEQESKPGRHSTRANKSNREQAKRESRVRQFRTGIRQSRETRNNGGKLGIHARQSGTEHRMGRNIHVY